MIANNIKKILFSILLLSANCLFNANADEELVLDHENEVRSALDYKTTGEIKSNIGKRSFSITPYFNFSFVNQTYKYLGNSHNAFKDHKNRQQMDIGISFDSYYNITNNFAISVGLSFGLNNLFVFSNEGTDYYFNVEHYGADDENVYRNMGSNYYRIKPIAEIVVPIRFKIRLNNYFSLEPYLFAGINISKIYNKYYHDFFKTDEKVWDDYLQDYKYQQKSEDISKSITVGLSTGCGLNLLLFKERVIVGAEYKYIQNKKYDVKFMVNTFSLKFAYRFHVL